MTKFLYAAFLALFVFTQPFTAHAQSDLAQTDEQISAARAAEVAEGEPAQEVIIGGFINDIQRIDLKTHSFMADIYVWFRWTNPDYNPVDSFEFMNLYDPEAHIQDEWYDEPQVMPDGSFYNVIRRQGAFSTKFPLDSYPFDKQEVRIIVEDAEYGVGDVVFVPDPDGLKLGASLKLPGYKVGKPELRITAQPYPTRFGDLSVEPNEAYSRASFVVPLERPWKSGIVKMLLPITIILLCAGLALLVHPRFTEGRIGLVITALLTLVALQITASSDLPEVGYLMVIDQIYLISYAFIMLVLVEVVENTWHKDEAAGEYARAIRRDRIALSLGLGAYTIALAAILFFNLS